MSVLPPRAPLPAVLTFLGGLVGLAAGCRAPDRDLPGPAGGPEPALGRFEAQHRAMGTLLRIVVHGPDAGSAERAMAAAFARVDELERALSDWDAGSELRRLDGRTDGGPMAAPAEVSADLARVLGTALDVGRLSAGAFDPTVGPYVRLWRRAARQGRPPTPEALERASRSVGLGHVELDAANRRVRLSAADMRLDLGGVAKGDAAQQALEVLRARGFERALVDAGGDLALGAPPPGAGGWRVVLAPLGVAAGEDPGSAPAGGVLLAADVALATSGDVERSVVLDGVRYSHLVDPRTGLGLAAGAAAVVVAPTGGLADALASALCVLEPRAGLALVESLPGVEARILRLEDGVLRACDSSGLGRMMAGTSALPAPRNASTQPAP